MAANAFVTPQWVVKEVSRIAQNSLKFGANVTRKYSSDFKAGGAKVGASFNLRLPQRFQTTKGQAFQQQAISDLVVPLTITDQANIGLSWSTFDATLSVENVRERYIRPAAIQLANTIDFDGLSRMTYAVYHAVGTPGTTPNNIQTYLDALTRLRNVAAPDDGIIAIISPNMSATLVAGTASGFNPQSDLSRNWRRGQFSGSQLGIDEWYYDQNTLQRTTGTFTTSTPVVNQATVAQGMSSIITSGWASGASTLRKGDKFTIAGVNEINPQNYASTGQLMQLTVTDTVSDVTGAMTIVFSPALTAVGVDTAGTAGGNYANVDNLPANGAALIPLGSTITTGSGTMATTVTRQGLVYHPEAFVLGLVDPDDDLPGAESKSVSDEQTGWSLRYVRQYNAQTDQKISRLDCFYGWLAYRPEWAVAVQGGAS